MKFFCFAVRPSISLNPGPLYVVEGSNATLPVCHVTGHPPPLVTWSKSFGQLPQGRYTVTTVALNCLESVRLILITTSALQLTC